MATKRFLLRDPSLSIPERIPLPPNRCVELKPGVSVERFFVQLATIAGEVDAWKVASWWSRGDTDHVTLDLDYLGETSSSKQGLKLVVSLISDESGTKLTLLFKDRSPETPDWTYQSYLTAVSYFSPLLRVYNRRHQARRRLRIPSPFELEPWLLIDEAVAFDWFREEARIKPSNAWNRLYWFIHAESKARKPIDSWDFARLLEINGIPEDDANCYAEIFEHGVQLLRWKDVKWDVGPPREVFDKWAERYNNQQWVE